MALCTFLTPLMVSRSPEPLDVEPVVGIIERIEMAIVTRQDCAVSLPPAHASQLHVSARLRIDCSLILKASFIDVSAADCIPRSKV